MRLLAGISVLPIGVDVGGRNIRAVQLKGGPGRWSVCAADSAVRDNPGAPIGRADAVQLRQLISEGAFKGRRVVLAVPNSQLLTGIMELPPRSSGAPLDQLARGELSRMHRCEPDSFEIACWDLPAPARAGGSTYVMAAGFSHVQADDLIDTIEAEGLNVHALDIHASAVSRACGPLLRGVEGIVSILDLGWDQANLVFLHQGVIVYERKLVKSGIGAVVDSLSREWKLHRDKAHKLVREIGLTGGENSEVSPDDIQAANGAVSSYCDALVEEMRIPLSYLTNQYPDATPETLLLIGGGSLVPGLEVRLDSLLNFYVRTVRPDDIVKCSPEIARQFGPSLTAAAGLGQFDEEQQ